jgi:AmpD protein
MQAITAEGWLTRARRAPSPNFDVRPAGTAIDLLVIHGISLPPGRFGEPYIEDFFLNRLDHAADPFFQGLRGVRVSSHALVRRDGELVQFVPLDKRAWHAGVSRFAGRVRCNDFSVGIELEGTDMIPYEAAQYRCLAQVTRALMRHYPGIDARRIAGHSDIASGRKTDPGEAFDWGYFFGLLKA